MASSRSPFLIAALCAWLVGCDRSPEPAPAATPSVPLVASTGSAAPPTFAACSACHAPGAGQHGIGPSLAGVFGKPAARLSDFDYSPALRDAELVWDAATLNRFLADPREAVPGTSMAYAGMRNAERRQQIIDWLKTI